MYKSQIVQNFKESQKCPKSTVLTCTNRLKTVQITELQIAQNLYDSQ